VRKTSHPYDQTWAAIHKVGIHAQIPTLIKGGGAYRISKVSFSGVDLTVGRRIISEKEVPKRVAIRTRRCTYVKRTHHHRRG
jgi:hypothetical protein